MEYKIVFDISEAGFKSWWFSASGLFFVVIGFGHLYFRKIFPYRGRNVLKRIFPYFFLGFAVLWTSTSFFSTWQNYTKYRDILKSGTCEITEGKVYDFVPMPYGGHADEHFKVDRRAFSYSDYEITAGFNNTSSHGGPIREGLQVKIWHHGNTILKLGIQE